MVREVWSPNIALQDHQVSYSTEDEHGSPLMNNMVQTNQTRSEPIKNGTMNYYSNHHYDQFARGSYVSATHWRDDVHCPNTTYPNVFSTGVGNEYACVSCEGEQPWNLGTAYEQNTYPPLKRNVKPNDMMCNDNITGDNSFVGNEGLSLNKRFKQSIKESETYFNCLLVSQLRLEVCYLIQDAQYVCKKISPKIKYGKRLCQEAVAIKSGNKKFRELVKCTFCAMKKTRSYIDDLVELVDDFKELKPRLEIPENLSEYDLNELSKIPMGIIQTLGVIEQANKSMKEFIQKLDRYTKHLKQFSKADCSENISTMPKTHLLLHEPIAYGI